MGFPGHPQFLSDLTTNWWLLYLLHGSYFDGMVPETPGNGLLNVANYLIDLSELPKRGYVGEVWEGTGVSVLATLDIFMSLCF